MTKSNEKTTRSEGLELKAEKSNSGTLLQIGDSLQLLIVSLLDGTSTIFRSVFGTFKDSAVFVIRSGKEVSDEFGISLKTCVLGTIEGTHEVSIKFANTFGKAVVDLTQCTFDTSSKVGRITKSAAISTIHGTAEVLEELFGKIKSGVRVIPFDRLTLSKKKAENN